MDTIWILQYDLISKMSLEKLKNYIRIPVLKVNGRKNELVARVFGASGNGVKPVNLKIEYLAKLKVDDRNMADPFKIPHGWINEDEGMKFGPFFYTHF